MGIFQRMEAVYDTQRATVHGVSMCGYEILHGYYATHDAIIVFDMCMHRCNLKYWLGPLLGGCSDT